MNRNITDYSQISPLLTSMHGNDGFKRKFRERIKISLRQLENVNLYDVTKGAYHLSELTKPFQL